MYCKNCGQQLDANAAVCTNCGFAAGTGTSFCANCGAQLTPGQAFCTACGTTIGAANTQAGGNVAAGSGEPKSKMVAGLLGIFLGTFGVHNFYLGFTKKALIQLLVSLLTCGIGAVAMEIWGIIEGIFYLTGKEGYTADANGTPLKD